MESKDMCLKRENEWWSNEEGYLNKIAGHSTLNLDMGAEMNMCGMSKQMNKMTQMCKEIYGENLKEVNWENLWEEHDIVSRTMCFSAIHMNTAHDDMCGEDWDMEWKDILDQLMQGNVEEGINNLVCYMITPIVKLDERQNEECSAIVDDDKIIEMGLEIGDIGLDAEVSGILLPLLKGMENLVTMNFADFADAGLSMMNEMGIGDMEAFTGWRLANNVMDMVMEIPRGMRMVKFDVEPSWKTDDFFCASGEVKRECRMECNVWSEIDNCKLTKGDRNPDGCNYDECNNCAVSWYAITASERVPFECAKCPFQDTLVNGGSDTGELVWTNEAHTEAKYVCSDGYAARECQYRAYCDPTQDDINLTVPECLKLGDEECKFPEVIDNAKLDGSFTKNNPSECPSARYTCNNGYFPKDDNRYASCRYHMNNWHVQMPTCYEQCDFPKIIDNGNFIQVYQNEDGIFAEYECDDGFYLMDRSYGKCYVKDDKVTAWVPKCSPVDTCEFPDSYNGAYKAEEWMDNGRKGARYQCPEGMEMLGSSYASCGGDMRSDINSTILCYNGPRCDFNDHIDGGWLNWDSSRPRVECMEGRVMEGDPWVSCERGEATYPVCLEQEDTCPLPATIENGYLAEKHHNKARYECNTHDGWKIPAGLEDGWVHCEGEAIKPMNPMCEEFSCDFEEFIANGELATSERNKAYYVCNKDYRFERENMAKCYEDGRIEYPNCILDNGPCDFTEVKVPNGYIEETTAYSARVECNDDFMFKDDEEWIYCNEDKELTPLPVCVKSCEFPDIDNGHKAEEHSDSARYECNKDYKMEGHDWVYCDTNTAQIDYNSLPKCVRDEGADHGGKCHFPEHIDYGKMYAMGDDWAVYYCYPPHVMQTNMELMNLNVQYNGMSREEAYRIVFGVAWCDKNNMGKVYMPKCVTREEAMHCGLPSMIEGGNATMFHGIDEEAGQWDPINPWAAEYICNDGYTMVETVHGNVGWCREDGSMEIPRCESTYEMKEVEFKLYQGKNKFFSKGDINTKSVKGIVFGQEFSVQDDNRNTEEGWEIACSEGFNDYAAGTVCRSFGFGGGVPMTVKAKMMDDGFKDKRPEFGWTRFSCNYDDTLVMR